MDGRTGEPGNAVDGKAADLDAAPRAPEPDELDSETANAFLHRVAEGLLMLDHEGLIRFANLHTQRLFGYRRDDLLGRSIELLLPGTSDDVARCRTDAGRNPFDIRAPQTRELVACRAGGGTFPAGAAFSALTSAGVPRVLCVVQDRSERQGAQQLLELTERRFEALFRASPAPTYVWQHHDDGFYLLDFNDAGAGQDDSSIRDLLGKGLHEIYADGSPVIEHVQRCFAEKADLVREIPDYTMRATGEVKDLRVTYVYVPPDIVLAFVQDLTPRKAYERDLHKLSSAVEQTADAVFITNRSGVIEYVNPAFERATGFPREEALGRTPRILKSGFQTPDYYHRLWGAILSGASFHATVINRRKSGELYHAEQTITPMKDARGRITHFVAVLRDMTETIKLREQETESNLARKIQRRLFPAEDPVLEGFDIAGRVVPAAATCGDYFDFIPMAGDALGIVVADACGHGMGPALIMAETRAYLRATAPGESDPVAILEPIHRALLADLDDRDYVTMILARLDPRARLITYASAGHVPAFLLGREGILVRELSSTGRPLGAVPDLAMRRVDPIALESGQIIVLLTDGLVETADAEDVEFGEQRIIEVVAANREASAREIVKRLQDEVKVFAHHGHLLDDLTAVVCKVL